MLHANLATISYLHHSFIHSRKKYLRENELGPVFLWPLRNALKSVLKVFRHMQTNQLTGDSILGKDFLITFPRTLQNGKKFIFLKKQSPGGVL